LTFANCIDPYSCRVSPANQARLRRRSPSLLSVPQRPFLCNMVLPKTGYAETPDLRPRLGPAVAIGHRAQRHHRIDVSPRPVHPRPLQARLDEQLVLRGRSGGNTAPLLDSCKPPISRRWPKPSSCGRITGTITSRVCLARMDDRVIETAGDPSSPEDDILACLPNHACELNVHTRRYTGREGLRAQMDAVCRDVTPIHLLWLRYQAVHQRHTTQQTHERVRPCWTSRHGDEGRRRGEKGIAVRQHHVGTPRNARRTVRAKRKGAGAH